MLGVVIPLEDSKNKQASVKPLVDLTKADMERVNQLILSKAGSDVQMIPEVANHLISSGGKRLRPMLTLAAASMFGFTRATPTSSSPPASSSCTPPPCCTTTSSTRATCGAANRRRGRSGATRQACSVGDFLLGQAFRMMVDVGSLDALDVPFDRRIRDRRGRGPAAFRRQEHGDDRGRLSARSSAPRQRPSSPPPAEVGPIVARTRARPSRNALEVLRHQSRPRLPAGRRRARLRRHGRAISARMSATISARARSPCRSFSPIAAARRDDRGVLARGDRGRRRATRQNLEKALGLITPLRAA